MVPRDIHIRFRKSWREVNHKNPFVRFAFENEMRGMANAVSNEKYVHWAPRVPPEKGGVRTSQYNAKETPCVHMVEVA